MGDTDPERLLIACRVLACMSPGQDIIPVTALQALMVERNLAPPNRPPHHFTQWIGRTGYIPVGIVDGDGQRRKYVERKAMVRVISACHGVVV